ncbi:MAG: hypothetical protein GXY48_02815 [Methanomicrobiales archaeon]|nr:hypothetical protein [Methanomicrobiales archaeon]
MDDRILLAGIIPLLIVACGCILIGTAYSFPFEAIIGLLLITLPIIFLIWYILIRVENLISGIKVQGKAIHKAFDDHSSEMKRKYEETMHQILELNTDLTRRVYR